MPWYANTMQKTERLVAITLLLQSRGKMTADRLADILDVSVRTIYRDMDALSLAHVPVSMDYGPGGGYFLPGDYQIERASFTSEEAVALALGGSIAGGSRLFESGDGLRRALFKLEATLPDEYVRRFVPRANASCSIPLPGITTRPARNTWRRFARPYGGRASSNSSTPVREHPAWSGDGSSPMGWCARQASGTSWHTAGNDATSAPFGWTVSGRSRSERRPRYLGRISISRRTGSGLEKLRAAGAAVRADFAGDRARALHYPSRGPDLERKPDGSAVVRVNLESASAAVQYALGIGPGARVIDPPAVAEGVEKRHAASLASTRCLLWSER